MSEKREKDERKKGKEAKTKWEIKWSHHQTIRNSQIKYALNVRVAKNQIGREKKTT